MFVGNVGDGEDVIREFPDMFTDRLGELKNFEHKIILKNNDTPVVHKVRKVQNLMLSLLEQEIDKLKGMDVIEDIESSEWLAPVVLVPKDNGTKIRMHVDLRDFNQRIWVDRQPLPNIAETLSMLKGAKIFSVMDLSAAYYQLRLYKDSKHLTSFVTPLGAFRFKRFPLGLASAAACFQTLMKKVLEGVRNVLFFQNDILIYGENELTHDATLKEVLERLRDNGLTVKREK
ncbi:hypothetical protein NDU88_001459 [Pleurodeles waltl]|uniref:ribonuclease H n=1 Tax=Pleurodeles waltl TaxID=8319 RepID=A0AAV7L9L7_PLEWA|nr:hypothetical protein NDU88_001459 [Pleurodeles waltl]